MKSPTWREIEAACRHLLGSKEIYHELRECVARSHVDDALVEMEAAAKGVLGSSGTADLLARLERFDRAQRRLDAASAAWKRESQAAREARL